MRYLLLALLAPSVAWAGPLVEKIDELKGVLVTGGISLTVIIFLVVNIRALVEACSGLLDKFKHLALKLKKGEMPSAEEVVALVKNADTVTEILAKIAARFGMRKRAKWLRDLIKLE